jgi:hypothetical protein
MRKQPRDKKGRFLAYDGTRGKKNYEFTLSELESAFLAGLNNQQRFIRNDRKFDNYLNSINYEKVKNE